MVLRIPKEKMRVICPDVGGGFGTKLFLYREYALIAVAAAEEDGEVDRRPRRSTFMGDAQGRDNVTTAKMALAEDGKFLGMDVDLMGDMGAYLSTFGPYISAWRHAHVAGPLRLPGVPLPGPHRVHQHRAGRCLSRRRTA
jgi:carbon-monoxide dehydrogenase large subunit